MTPRWRSRKRLTSATSRGETAEKRRLFGTVPRLHPCQGFRQNRRGTRRRSRGEQGRLARIPQRLHALDIRVEQIAHRLGTALKPVLVEDLDQVLGQWRQALIEQRRLVQPVGDTLPLLAQGDELVDRA